MIRLCDVSFSYADAPALVHVDLAIERGEALALVGPNGSGKSTLLKLLNALVFPQAGTYLFDGEEISHARLKDQASTRHSISESASCSRIRTPSSSAQRSMMR